MTKSQVLSSVTVIVVARDYPVDLPMIDQLLVALNTLFVDVEIVIVCNGVSTETSIKLKEFCETLPDCTVLFLNEEIHDDVARLIGIDHAISDYVLFATPHRAEIDALPAIVAALREGNDMVISEGQGGVIVRRDWLLTGLFGIFRWLYRLMSGRSYEANPPMFRVLSRAAALYIATRSDGEVLVRARTLGQGFPSTVIKIGASPPLTGRGMPVRLAVAKAFRLLLTGSALPLRISSYLGFVGGLVSVAYAAYVMVIYMFKARVEPGWTTLSLQSAGMMFLFSLQFLFLSEYLVQILSTSPTTSRRQFVARELRSSRSNRSLRLNVVDSEGQFHLGAPKHLVGQESR
jgi:polyisoprenyl-phosphate glycosyltransferase